MSRSRNRRTLQHLIQQARERGPKGMLNHAVVLLAQDVNKHGMRAQLQFLIKNVGMAAAARLLREFLVTEEAVTSITREAVRGNRLGLLHRILYDSKIAEGHKLTQSSPRNVVRALVHELGAEAVAKLVNRGLNDRIRAASKLEPAIVQPDNRYPARSRKKWTRTGYYPK